MRSILAAVVLAVLAVASPAFASDAQPKQAAPAEKCEHGVKKGICTRCNPKLEAVFKAKGDWCPEHARPESQCVKCNSSLAKQGVK
jgi:serine protease inhibitor ecotin